MRGQGAYLVPLAVAMVFSHCLTPTAGDLVYNSADWPAINMPLLTGSGAPVAAANPAFSAEVNFVAASGLPPVRKTSENPQTGGQCPSSGNFGSSGQCWFTCGLGTDGFPCAAPDDVKVCKPGKWGLTYDDGPTSSTELLLDSLKKNNKTATFCLVGSNVVRFPSAVKRIQAEGHDLCIHTWSHSALTTLTDDQIIAELKWTEKAIEAASGVKPRYWRPPYGDVDNRVRAIATKMGYKNLLWYFDNGDYLAYGTNPTSNKTTVHNTMKEGLANRWFPNGVVALSHPERGGSLGVTVAEDFFALAASAGIGLMPVSQCLGEPPSGVTATTAKQATTTPAATASNTPTPTPESAKSAESAASALPRFGSFLVGSVVCIILAVGIQTGWALFTDQKED